MIEITHIDKQRLVYTLDELSAGDIVDWKKAVALIGDGESKCKYIFNREKVITYGVNRAARRYPSDFCITSGGKDGHESYLKNMIPPYLPLVTYTKEEIKNHGLLMAANAIVFLSFLIKWVEFGPIFLQGFNFSSSGLKNYNWNNQARGFKQCYESATRRNLPIFMTHYNDKLDFIPVVSEDEMRTKYGDLYL